MNITLAHIYRQLIKNKEIFIMNLIYVYLNTHSMALNECECHPLQKQ